ncbi:MAG: EamA family transporter [Bryobacteraceae bacterium]
MTATPFSSIALVFGASFLGSIGAVFLKSASGRINRDVWSIVMNWRLAAGIVMYVLSSLFYLKGIKQGELTILFPMVSLGYVWTLFWSRLFFQEEFTKSKFIGLGFIIAGIVLLAFGKS